jgi:Ca2+-binding EF-hand superfamily protein
LYTSGELTRNEVDKFVIDLLNALEKREIQVAQELYDTDKKSLSQETKDIKNLYKNLRDKKAEIMEKVDTNGDGTIEFSEFVNFLNNFRASDVKNLGKK